MQLPSVTAKDVIFKALHMTAICMPTETPTLNYIQTALDLLNEQLSTFSATKLHIPYRTKLSFTPINNQGSYTIGALPTNDIVTTAEPIELLSASIQYQINNSWLIPIEILVPEELDYCARNQNAYTYPLGVSLERGQFNGTLEFLNPIAVNSGALVYLTFAQAFLQVTLDTIMTDCPQWYLKFLRYKLAFELIGFYQIGQWTEAQQKLMDKLETMILAANFTLKVSVPRRDLPQGDMGWSYARSGYGLWGPW